MPEYRAMTTQANNIPLMTTAGNKGIKITVIKGGTNRDNPVKIKFRCRICQWLNACRAGTFRHACFIAANDEVNALRINRLPDQTKFLSAGDDINAGNSLPVEQ